MLDSMRFAVGTSNNVLLKLKSRGRDTSLDFKGALALATRGSARACHVQDRVGGFDVGKQFDALRVRMSNYYDTQLMGFETMEDMIQKFVFVGNDRNVVQVYVQGRCVKNIV